RRAGCYGFVRLLRAYGRVEPRFRHSSFARASLALVPTPPSAGIVLAHAPWERIDGEPLVNTEARASKLGPWLPGARYVPRTVPPSAYGGSHDAIDCVRSIARDGRESDRQCPCQP